MPNSCLISLSGTKLDSADAPKFLCCPFLYRRTTNMSTVDTYKLIPCFCNIMKEHDVEASKCFYMSQPESRQSHSGVFTIHPCFWDHRAEVFELTLHRSISVQNLFLYNVWKWLNCLFIWPDPESLTSAVMQFRVCLKKPARCKWLWKEPVVFALLTDNHNPDRHSRNR